MTETTYTWRRFNTPLLGVRWELQPTDRAAEPYSSRALALVQRHTDKRYRFSVHRVCPNESWGVVGSTRRGRRLAEQYLSELWDEPRITNPTT